MSLASLRAGVDAARPHGGAQLAVALLELAEAEPLFEHRQPAVRAPLEQAASRLDGTGEAALEGRTLLRLGQVKLLERDLEAVEQLATRARDRLGDDRDRLADVETLLARSAIRRHEYERAKEHLVAATELLGEEPATPAAGRATATLGLAWVELAVEQHDFGDAESRLAVLAELDDRDEELAEVTFVSRQLGAVIALVRGDRDRAIRALRSQLQLTRHFEAVEDELETRVALAGALVEGGDAIALDEADKHLQIARDRSSELGLDSLHMAALTGQAGVLAKKGKIQGALSRCLEIAKSASEKQDVARYLAAVSLMSLIYEQQGDLASAYRTFAEAHASLKSQLGDRATELFRRHLAAFAERIGHDKFREIADKVNAAAHAREALRKL